MKRRLLTCILVLIVTSWAALEGQQKAVRQDEIVSFKNDMTYSQAITALSEISKRVAGKPIVDPSPMDNTGIGVNVESKHWLEALQMILAPAGRTFREEADYYLVTNLRGSSEGGSQAAGGAGGAAATKPGEFAKEAVDIDSREVQITTIFFDLDVNKSQSYGLDWSLSFLKGKDSLAVDFSSPAGNTPLRIGYARPYRYGDILAAVQMLSQSGIGEVISSPRIVVRSSEQGKVQVGTDISITERTIGAGGTVTTSVRQLPTGTIVTVTPKVLKEGNINFVYLTLIIEQSNALSSGDAPTISRNSTNTSILLVDGEEVFMSGLYTNRESITRTGVPFLKDLPWWVFGLRYIFGNDIRTSERRELAILLKADIVPTLRERAAQKIRENAMEMQRKSFEKDVDRLKTKKDTEKE